MLNLSKKIKIYFYTPVLYAEHNFCLSEHKIWNFLLLHAHHNLLTQEYHQIELKELLPLFPLNNLNYIYQKLNNITTKNRSKSPWEYYFEDLKIKNNCVVFKYPHQLKILLSNKCTYEILKKLNDVTFESKYSLFLYELFLYMEFLKHANCVPTIPLRRYLGLTPKQYINTKYFLNDVLIKAIHEITIKTDLDIKLKIIKEGKQPSFFAFDITREISIKNITKEDKYNFMIINTLLSKSHTLLNEEINVITENIINQYISPKEKVFIKRLISNPSLENPQNNPSLNLENNHNIKEKIHLPDLSSFN